MTKKSIADMFYEAFQKDPTLGFSGALKTYVDRLNAMQAGPAQQMLDTAADPNAEGIQRAANLMGGLGLKVANPLLAIMPSSQELRDRGHQAGASPLVQAVGGALGDVVNIPDPATSATAFATLGKAALTTKGLAAAASKAGPAIVHSMFIGPKALIADQKALGEFEKLFARGNTTEGDMWKRTGWGISQDNHRYSELDDSASQLIVDANNLPTGEVPIGDVFRHDDLLKAYPQTSDVKVKFDPSTNDSYQLGNKLVIGSKSGDPEFIRSKIVHELNHYAQEIEGFDTGTNPLYAGRINYNDSIAEVASRNAENRIDMSPEQRRNVHPNQTADVPVENQISSSQIASGFRSGATGPGVEVRKAYGSDKYYLVDRWGNWSEQSYASRKEAYDALSKN
jgi:hypothetical protein